MTDIEPLDPRIADIGMRPRQAITNPNFGIDPMAARSRRFRAYTGAGYDVDEAQALASDPGVDPMHVRRVNDAQRYDRLRRTFAELEPDKAKRRWKDLNDDEREYLRGQGFVYDAPKQGGLFGVPVLGGLAKGALGAGTWVAENVNDATMGTLGQAIGAGLEGAEWLQEKVNEKWREREFIVRRDGWARIFTPYRGKGFYDSGLEGFADYDTEGENSFRPGTMDTLTAMADGNRPLADMVRMMARGWTDDQILKHQGFDEDSDAYGTEFAALARLRESEDVRQMLHYAERQKMSPGRAWANLLGAEGTDYALTSGLVDGLWAMFADPTLAVGKGVKIARLSRFTRFNTSDQFLAKVDDVLGEVGKLEDARRIRTVDGAVINPLERGTYFAGLRKLRAEGYSAEQVEMVMFMDHMLAGTKAGGTGAVGDDGVAEILGQYAKLRPKQAGMAAAVTAQIAKGEVHDVHSLAATLRNGALLDSMRSGAGRPIILDRAPGLFVPRLSRAGTVKLQAKLAMDDVIDWGRQTTFSLKAGETLGAKDYANAKVFLSETMRAARQETQPLLDDYVDFAEAMRGRGFDADTIADVTQRRMAAELGGLVIDGEQPVYALARLAVREGRVDEDGVRAIHGALRALFPDDAQAADDLVGAFDDAATRYFNTYVDGKPASYAETLLDDAQLDTSVQQLVAGLDAGYDRYVTGLRAGYEEAVTRAEETAGIMPDPPTILDRKAYYDQAFDGGLYTAVKADAVDESLEQFRREWTTRGFELRTPTGATTRISDPDQYRTLVADIARDVVDERLDDLIVGEEILLNSKLKRLRRVARSAIRIPTGLARQMPQANYIEFGTEKGINELRRWLDLGVYGDDAKRLLGEFMAAESDATRRAVLFSAQREMLRHTGILYDPKHADWVREVLGATHQFYGGAAWVDNAGQLRPMALFPQAQRANAMRLNDARDLMAHFQRGRFMELFSPRYGRFLARTDAGNTGTGLGKVGRFFAPEGQVQDTVVQRVNRYWKPAAVASPRLILRAGLDEILTLVGAEGLANVNARYLRHHVLRMQQKRFSRAVALSKVDVAGLRAGAYETVAGDLDLTVDDLYAQIDAVRSGTVPVAEGGDPAAALRAAQVELATTAREMIRGGYLRHERIWELPPDELNAVLAQASADNLFTARRPILEKWAPHLTESARLTERIADGIIEWIAPRINLTEGHMRAAMAMAVDPVLQKSMTADMVHAGAWWDARELLDPNDPLAKTGDAEELGILRLVDADGNSVIEADTNDLLGRKGLTYQMELAQRDDFVRQVIAPIVRMELDDDVRGTLAATIGDELPWVQIPETVTVGDPFATDVVDGLFAPLVERAVRDQDPVLLARGQWLALPDEVRAEMLDVAAARNGVRTVEPAAEWAEKYVPNMARLGIDETSALYLDRNEYEAFVEWINRPGIHTDKRWQIMVDDTAVRPGGPVDRLTAARIADERAFYSVPVQDAIDNNVAVGHMALEPHRVAQTRMEQHTSVWRLADRDDRFLLNDEQPLPMDLRKALREGNDALLYSLNRLGADATPWIEDLSRLLYLDVDDPAALNVWMHELDSRIATIEQGFGEEAAGQIERWAMQSIEGPLLERNIVGFARGMDETMLPLNRAGDADSVGILSGAHDAFDTPSWEQIPVESLSRLEMEGALRDRFDRGVDDWLDLLQGLPADTNALARDRKIEFLTRTAYWEQFRAHDLAGKGNDVVHAVNPDDIVLHVPHRKGTPLAGTADPANPILGTVDPELADEYLRLVAGGEPEQWELIEVPVNRADLAGRRVGDVDTTNQMLAGFPAADIPPAANRFGDQLFTLLPDDLARARLRPDIDDTVVVLPDRAAISTDWGRRLEDGFWRLDEDLQDLFMPFLDGRGGTVDDAMFNLTDDPDVLARIADHDETLAIDAFLADVVDQVGVSLTPALVNDQTGRLLRTKGMELARQRGIEPALITRLADFQAANGYRPDWLSFTAPDRGLSAQVRAGKHIDTAAREFVGELDANLRGMFFDSHKGRPLWDLLGPVERKAFTSANVDSYHGALPRQVIRPKMQAVDDRHLLWKWTEKGFDFIAAGIAEVSRYPMWVDNFAKALDQARLNRLATPRHLAREADYQAIFGANYDELMLRFENEFAALVTADERATLLTELDDDLVVAFSQFYGDLPTDRVDDFKAFLGAEMVYRERERRDAMLWALRETTPYIDDHRVRSQFADMVDDVIPFFYATEHFIRRWARTTYHSPEMIRRLQLYYHGMQASGTVVTDPETGEDLLAYPMTGFLMETIGNLIGPDSMVPGVNFHSKTLDVLPGLREPLRFGAGPTFLAPLSLMRVFAPQEVARVEEFLGGERAVGRDLLEVFLPASITRFGTVTTGSERDTVAVLAYLEANQPWLIPGAGVDEDGNVIEDPAPPTMAQWQGFLDDVRNATRVVGAMKGIYGLFTPGSPRVDFDVDNLNQEFVDLLDAGLPMEQAVGEFLARHPHATPYTIFDSSSESGAPTQPTQAVFDHLDANREFYDSFDLAAPWLLPFDAEAKDEFDQSAWSEMIAMGMRERKDPEEWWRDLKFAQGAQLYFPMQQAKEAALARARDREQEERIEQTWRTWLGEFTARHPMFIEDLTGQKGKNRRTRVRAEMRTALADPNLPYTPAVERQVTNIAGILDGFDQLSLMLEDHRSYSFDERKAAQAGFARRVWQITEGDPMARAFFQRTIQPDLELPTGLESYLTGLSEEADGGR